MYSIDPEDAMRYGYKYINTIYSKCPVQDNKAKIDILFVGRAKDRLIFLHQLAHKLGNAGLSYRFFIFGVKKQMQINDENIIYNQYLPYNQVLKYVCESNFILELIQGGQTGVTFRWYECFLYNKVLVTKYDKSIPNEFNNMNIVVFKDTDDLIIKLKQYKKHGYKIDNRFSPTHLISQIEIDS